jgi:hypothetical protein
VERDHKFRLRSGGDLDSEQIRSLVGTSSLGLGNASGLNEQRKKSASFLLYVNSQVLWGGGEAFRV